MKISKIEKKGNKYKIILDDSTIIKTYDDVIINNGLLYNKTIDSNLLNKINIDNNYYDIYYKVVNYITRKLRSLKEINEYIDSFNVPKKDKENIIKKLKEINLINDENYARAYAFDRINLSNDGPLKVENDLLKQDITEEIINRVMVSINSDFISEKLLKLINKKVKNTKYSGYRLKQKVVCDLVNLGYDRLMIESLYDTLNLDNNDLLNKEYNKIYNHLHLKYSGNELYNKIKSKLYQKGFTIEEINSLEFIDKC